MVKKILRDHFPAKKNSTATQPEKNSATKKFHKNFFTRKSGGENPAKRFTGPETSRPPSATVVKPPKNPH